MVTYNTVNEAFYGNASQIMDHGVFRQSRNGGTMEVVGNTFTISEPLHRFLMLPHRHDNPFAKVAETMWVLAGRNDMNFLSHYLPRAVNFSDDGDTWRAGYGTRLRSHFGVDQLMEVVNLLREDPQTRRASMVIFDPSIDYDQTVKDIPCNNWINFQSREGYLDMMIAVRSNDLMWGFSGINQFEWSVLQEIVAYWAGLEVGKQVWLQGSLHIYENHFDRVRNLLMNQGKTFTYQGKVARFFTPIEEFDSRLDQFFENAERWRTSPNEGYSRDDKDLFDLFEHMMYIYWAIKHQTLGISDLIKEIYKLQDTEAQTAALNYLKFVYRDKSYNLRIINSSVCDYNPKLVDHLEDMVSTYVNKGKAYGNSWIKRGELFSVLPNIERKVDRLVNVFGKGYDVVTSDETIIDTVEDLYIYICMYLGYLFDNPVYDWIVKETIQPTMFDDLQLLTEGIVKEVDDLFTLVLKEFTEENLHNPTEPFSYEQSSNLSTKKETVMRIRDYTFQVLNLLYSGVSHSFD